MESSEPAPMPVGNPKGGPVRSFLGKIRGGKAQEGATSRKRRLLIRATKVLVVLAASWLLAAYVILPALWRHF